MAITKIYLIDHTLNLASYTTNILITPVPNFSIGQSFSPYSRLEIDPVTFSCSITYSASTLPSISWAILEFKFGSSSTVQNSDSTLATAIWGASFSSSFSTYSSQISTFYYSRISNVTKVLDTGAFKNLSITLGISGSTYSPNYYTLSDVGYYYCQLTDSTTSTTYSNVVPLTAYCM